ncbi:nucleoside diphosphate kinase regulator [Hymenobacter aerilatus]|uniref:Nucleoside diphosphate kinase regulator n=1 Tax=Hymenobacter aerilatus TaxID=2932251 RepID=A0A8T9SZT3_9BACT|nr:nucleoside diphosphate kinase regulator [Hymenobacter aerilatus]UOR07385.1 nucleoside diphosphate kinase regulator [Hymenobacter aerilatus]
MRTSQQVRPIYITKPDHDRLQQLVQLERHAHGNERVEALSHELKRAQLVNSYDVLPDVITMNSRVKLRDMRSNAELEITLVYPKYADMKSRKISILAPVATAVLGCRVGDTVVWPVPNGEAKYWVEAILHQPEAAGDWVS